MFTKNVIEGSEKVVRKFLLFPRTLRDNQGVKTTRWLSIESINYLYEDRIYFFHEDGHFSKAKWWPESWANKRNVEDVFMWHPKDGDTVTKEKFLFFPKTLADVVGNHKTRKWGFFKVKYIWKTLSISHHGYDGTVSHKGWAPVVWGE